MSDTIKIKDVKTENINDKINDQIYIDTSNNKGLNIYNTKVNILGSKSFSKSAPIYNGSGQELQFNIPTNGQTLSTSNSKLVYTMKFVFRLPNSSDWYGKIVLTSMGWYFIPCTVAFIGNKQSSASNTTSIRLYEKQEDMQYFYGSCGGSYGILESSEVQYGSVNQKDQQIHIRNNVIQSTLTQEFVNSNNTTFFDTTNRIMEIEHMPFVWDSTNKCKKYANAVADEQNSKYDIVPIAWGDAQAFATNTAGYPDSDSIAYVNATTPYIEYTVYKQFSCPLSLINQVFDVDDHVFYMQALNQNSVRLTLKLLPYYMSEIFGSSQLLDRQKTGITDIYLQLYSSNSDDVQGLILSKDRYCTPFMRYQVSTQMINDPSVPVNDQLINGFTSLSSVALCLYRQDQGQTTTDMFNGSTIEAESNYIHGRLTLFTPNQLYKIYNNIYDQSEQFIFFNRLQINRGSTTYKLFSDPLDSISDMMNEVNRSLNFNNQKSEGKLECYDSYLKTMMKYAYVFIAFDNASLVDGPSAVVYDGYESNQNKVNYTYYLSYYDANKGVSPDEVAYNSNNVPAKCKIANDNYSMLAIQNYDEVMIVNTKNHTIQIVERPVGQLVK